MHRRHVFQLAAAALASSCSQQIRLKVGAKNFVEQDILGEIIAQHLQKQLGSEVTKKLHLGGTLIAHEALLSGAIDVYPEYSGTALTTCLKLPIEKDPAKVYDQVREAYATRHKVEWGWRLGFANNFAMVMRREDATLLNIATLSDAVERKKNWRLGFGYEFEQREDGWPSFHKAYPLDASGGIKTMDLGLIYRALQSDSVDMVAGNSTDPALADNRFIALTDDKLFFPPYEACIAVRNDAIVRFADLSAALDLLAGKISVDQMRNWNAKVAVQHASVENVAADFVAGINHA